MALQEQHEGPCDEQVSIHLDGSRGRIPAAGLCCGFEGWYYGGGGETGVLHRLSLFKLHVKRVTSKLEVPLNTTVL